MRAGAIRYVPSKITGIRLTLHIRRVTTTSSTGSTDSTRVRLNLTIRVKKVSMAPVQSSQLSHPDFLQTSFSPSASSSNGATSQDPKNSTATLQINGTVTNENDYVKLGAHHTLDLEGKLCLSSSPCVSHLSILQRTGTFGYTRLPAGILSVWNVSKKRREKVGEQTSARWFSEKVSLPCAFRVPA